MFRSSVSPGAPVTYRSRIVVQNNQNDDWMFNCIPPMKLDNALLKAFMLKKDHMDGKGVPTSPPPNYTRYILQDASHPLASERDAEDAEGRRKWFPALESALTKTEKYFVLLLVSKWANPPSHSYRKYISCYVTSSGKVDHENETAENLKNLVVQYYMSKDSSRADPARRGRTGPTFRPDFRIPIGMFVSETQHCCTCCTPRMPSDREEVLSWINTFYNKLVDNLGRLTHNISISAFMLTKRAPDSIEVTLVRSLYEDCLAMDMIGEESEDSDAPEVQPLGTDPHQQQLGTSAGNQLALTSGLNQQAVTSGHNQQARTSGHNHQARTSAFNQKLGSTGHNQQAVTSGHNQQAMKRGHTHQARTSAPNQQLESPDNKRQARTSANNQQPGANAHNQQLGSSGHNQQAKTRGNNQQLGNSGQNQQLGTSGHNQQLETSGHNQQARTSGNNQQLGNSGHNQQPGAGAHNQHLRTTGGHHRGHQRPPQRYGSVFEAFLYKPIPPRPQQ